MLILNYTKRTALRTTILAVFDIYNCMWHNGIPFSLCNMIDHVGLAARLARIPASTLMCVYAHINPSVKRVLDTSIMTSKVN